MGKELERSLVHESFEIRSEFPLCRQHDAQRPYLWDKRLQGRGVSPFGYHMPDGHAPVCLFKSEMTEVREYESEFLFVIGTPGRLPADI